jgi:magnesium chelatase accessory protein
MSTALNFNEHRATWPNAAQSTLFASSGLQWHIQRWIAQKENLKQVNSLDQANELNQIPVQPIGDKEQASLASDPTIVLLHGTGASAHSWAGLAPLLSKQFNILALDLPGHGFTELADEAHMSSKGMAQLILQLLADLKIPNSIFIGHSAGATIAVECLGLGANIKISAIISINGALLPFGSYNMPGMASFAKALSKNRLIPKIFSLQARYVPLVDHLLDGTGSKIPLQSKQCYQVLVSNAQHARAALIMMAQWNLIEFAKRLPTAFSGKAAGCKFALLACSGDRTVSPKISEQAHQQVATSQLIRIPSLGHMGHEEDPAQFAKIILDILAS